MRSTLALAAALVGGLAASPALASSATFYDFTIEITDRAFAGDNPLFDGKNVGDTFDGELSVTFPVADEVVELNQGEFALESLSIDGLDSTFFVNPVVTLDDVNDENFVIGGVLSRQVFIKAFGVLGDDDADELTGDELLALLQGASENTFLSGGTSLDFDVTAASIRLDHGPSVIPLPAAGWLLFAGLGGLAVLRRRQTA